MADPLPSAPVWLVVHVDLRRNARVRALVEHVRARLPERLARRDLVSE